MDSSGQFKLATLLVWIAACSFFMASSHWALTSTMLGTPEDIPLAYVLGFPLMGFGLIVVPFLCFACLLAIIGLSFVHMEISMSTLMFLGYAGLAILASSWPTLEWWSSGFRIVTLMILCAAACIWETRQRKLPAWNWWVSGLAIATTGGYYLHLVASVACMAS